MVMMMVVMAAVPICPAMNGMPRVPPSGPPTPVPGRRPAYPIGTPKPVIDNRSVDIYRLDDIVLTVDVFVANNLYGDVIGFVLLDVDGSNILIDILSKHRLQDN